MATYLRRKSKKKNALPPPPQQDPDSFLPMAKALKPGNLHIKILGNPRNRRAPLACDRERHVVTLEIQFARNLFWITGPRPRLQDLLATLREKPTPYPHHWPLTGLHAVRYDPHRDQYQTLSSTPQNNHTPRRRKQ